MDVNGRQSFLAWLPWLMITVIVIIWSFLQFGAIGTAKINWPGLDNLVYLTLYHKPYEAVWVFQPLGSGTPILLAVILTAIALRASGRTFW
jgi:lactate permease